jgi:hypothetical protein
VLELDRPTAISTRVNRRSPDRDLDGNEIGFGAVR